ncbi:MAG TPA: CbiX/SirB N-terminal domain-containing protein, partial [Nodosilinea sp.]|nr:CbiX/SirB N-terminal domain-containing protein [Nodosilinea sp.]
MSASASTAYLLVSHGSRDPRPGQAMERLAHFVRSQESGLWEASARSTDCPKDRPGNRRPTQARLAGGQASLSLRQVAPDWLCSGRDDALAGEPGIYRARVSLPETFNGPLVGTACLEAEALPLHRQIVEFSRRARAAGAQRVRLVPLFLLAGVHVMDDIPAEVEQARQALPDLTLEVCPHLGSHPGIKGLLRRKLHATATETPILLA